MAAAELANPVVLSGPAAQSAPVVAAGARAVVQQRLSALDNRQRIGLALGLALIIGIVVAAVMLTRQNDWKVLFANLSDRDGGAVVAQLVQMNVPYRYTEGGGAIMVPANRVHDLRLRLASQGLPKGSVTGLEITDTPRFGITQFQERLNFQRGLEGELTRSIQSLSSVRSARVHLAVPNQNGFFREQQKPSASVLLSLHAGRSLDRSQIAGIVNLVASSVPEMHPSAVSVVDESGKLLSQPPEGSGASSGADAEAQRLAIVAQIEQAYVRRIIEILEPVVGAGNVRASVTAELDYSQTETTAELHKPNLAADASAVRSQQTVESVGEANTQATGVPGAVANQPPGQAQVPINGRNPGLATTGPAAGAAAGQSTATNAATRRETITNYEVDRTVRVVRGQIGALKRLTAAVVVNHQSTPGEDGKVEAKPLSEEQIEKMTTLVRNAVGFNQDRGDSVNLMNTPFVAAEAVGPSVPLWQRPEVIEVATNYAWPLSLLVLATIVVFGLLRPALKAMGKTTMMTTVDGVLVPVDSPQARAAAQAAASGTQLNATVGGELDRPALEGPGAVGGTPQLELAASPEQLRLEQARAITRNNPVQVANIIKSWISGEDVAAANDA
jgi:flagellar M-ring protein FliF